MVSSTQVHKPINACNNQVPVQLIGAQVPAQDIFAALAALSNGNTTNATQSESCTNPPTETNTSTVNS